jgi:uncharacterized membrane-anchored protein
MSCMTAAAFQDVASASVKIGLYQLMLSISYMFPTIGMSASLYQFSSDNQPITFHDGATIAPLGRESGDIWTTCLLIGGLTLGVHRNTAPNPTGARIA